MAALRKPSPTNVRPIGDFCNKIGQKRPNCSAAKVAPYSITSSASATTAFGKVSPSAFAVLRLITNSNLLGR
jgi:hypothetical protein